jgi:hypothetical protein
MKRLSFAVFPAAAFLVIAASAAVESHAVFLNGKLIGNAIVINGVPALAVEDLAKAAGLNMTLEPGFELRGTTLTAKTVPGRLKWQNINLKRGVDAAAKQGAPAPVVTINNGGVISRNVLTYAGKPHVPLVDLAQAFRATLSLSGNLRPGEPINLNFTPNSNAILVGR